MPGQQEETGVDLYGEGFTRAQQEQRRQLQGYQTSLTYNPPVNERMIAQENGYETPWNQQIANYGPYAGYQQPDGHFVTNNQGFAIANYSVVNGAYHQGNGQYDINANSRNARFQEMRVATDEMTEIMVGEKDKKKKKGKGKEKSNY